MKIWCLLVVLAPVMEAFLFHSRLFNSKAKQTLPQGLSTLLMRKTKSNFDVYEDELCESVDISTPDAPDMLQFVNGNIDLDKLDEKFMRTKIYKQRFPANSLSWIEKADQNSRTVLEEAKEYGLAYANGDVTGFEGFYNPIDPHDMHKPFEVPPNNIRKWFVCMAECPVHKLGTRGQAWMAHMQWVRRTAMLVTTPIVAPATVIDEYTILSQNRLFPTTQILFIMANNTQAVLDYLSVEPLAVCGGIKPWNVYQWRPPPEFRTEVGLPVYPYMYLGLLKSSPNSMTTELFNHSRTFMQQSCDATSPFRLLNTSRVIQYGHLHAINVDNGEGIDEDDDKPSSPPVGELLLMNALSKGDAQRFLGQNPILSSQAAYWSPYQKAVLHKATDLIDAVSSGEFENPLHLKTLQGPVNIQDADGFGLHLPRSFNEKAHLDEVHFMDPQDLLRVDKCVFPPNSTLPLLLPNHFKENKKILKLLQDNDINLSCARFDPYGVGCEVDKTSLAYKLSLIDNMEDFKKFRASYVPHAIQEKALHFKELSLLPEPPLLMGRTTMGKTAKDIVNYPPYTKEKLEKKLTHLVPFLDSEDESITVPVMNPAFIQKMKDS